MSRVRRSPTTAGAQVIAIGAPVGFDVGVAFVEPAPEHHLTEEGLREALGGRLARFKMPKRFILSPNLPRTASGKIDKPALARDLLT